MVVLCIIMFSIFGFCVFFSQHLKLRIEEAPIITVTAISLILYIFALANLLVAAVYVLLVLGCVLLVLTLTMRRKMLKEVAISVLQPGMVIFLLGIPLIYLLSRNVILYYWDEFSHWGVVVKAMNMTGALPTKDSMLTFPTYPPGTALFQFFISKLLGQKEGHIVFANVLLIWSASMVLIRNIKWKQLPLVIIALGLAFVGYIHFSNSMWSIYVDGILGFFAGCTFSMYYQNQDRKPTDIVKTIPLLAFITLIKESGIFISILLCLLMAADQWYLFRKSIVLEKKAVGILQKHPYVFSLLLAFFVPVITNVSWAIHLAMAGMKNGQSIAQNFLLNAGGKAVNIGIFPAFMNAFVSTAIGQTKPGYEFLSNAAFYIIFILVTIMIYFIFNKDKSSRNRASLIIGVLILETFIYSIGLILIYKYKFNNYEGTHLASYGRYMSTFFLMFFLSLFTVMLPRMKDASLKMHQRILPAILSIVLIFTLYMSTPFRLINIRFKITSDALRTAITQSAVIIKSVIKPGDHIYIIWENTSGREYLISKYEIYPAQANISWSIGTPYGDKDIWTKNITVDEWAKMLEGYQYVYIGKSDEQFTTRYGSLFQNGNIQSGSIYTVTAQGIRHILLVPLQAQPR